MRSAGGVAVFWIGSLNSMTSVRFQGAGKKRLRCKVFGQEAFRPAKPENQAFSAKDKICKQILSAVASLAACNSKDGKIEANRKEAAKCAVSACHHIILLLFDAALGQNPAISLRR